MGMFDSLYDADGQEWQTKAFDCQLDTYRVGDTIKAGFRGTYQVEVFGGPRPSVESFATIRRGTLAAVPDARDPRLPLLDYSGRFVGTGDADLPAPDDSEVDEAIASADTLTEALFEIAEKYGANVTNNEPRWQDGVYLREVGDFIGDVIQAVRRHPLPGVVDVDAAMEDTRAALEGTASWIERFAEVDGHASGDVRKP